MLNMDETQKCYAKWKKSDIRAWNRRERCRAQPLKE